MPNVKIEIPHSDILIVDDTPNNLRLLSQMLAEQGHRVRAVTSGARALEAVRTASPDLILLDIRMPQMDGFAVCEQLKTDAQTRDIPVIFISALDDVEDKVRALTIGGVDYITKPFQLEEVLVRVETHLALRKLQKQLQDANARFQHELTLAGKIQVGILPRALPDIKGWQLAATLKPARETSGDFYDISQLPNGQIMILIADVVDKGAGAALYMVLCFTLIRTYAAEYPTRPELVLRAVNHRLMTDIECDEFVTAFYGVLDPASGAFTYCNAGHNPPYLVKKQGDEKVQKLPQAGMAMGVVENTSWDRGIIQFDPGDTLVLYTDGITDAQNVAGEFFGTDRLLDSARANLNRPARDVAETIIADVQEFVGDAQQFDDLALVVVSRDSSRSGEQPRPADG
jgi:sigma-B regulation protein RsbU (phosphoserine phosphatase)